MIAVLVVALALARVDAADPIVAEQIRSAERAVAAARQQNTRGRALADTYGALARVNHVYEFFDDAEAAYLEAARLDGRDARWPHLLGYLYQQTGRLEEAAPRFVTARRLQPGNHAASVRLAQVYLGLGRLREARDEFEGITATFPALSRQGLGDVALREGRFEDAVTYLRDALDRVPEATSLHYQLAMAYRGMGRLDDARTHLERRGTGGIRVGDPIVDALQSLVRGERGLVMQGRRAYEAGQFSDAADAFARAAADAPASATARFNLGMAILQLGDTPSALAHLQQAFALDPADAQAGRELARVLLRAARREEAISVLAKVVAADGRDEDSAVSLALLLTDRERYRDAIRVLEGAYQQHPDGLATATTLARLLSSAPDRALRNGQRALALATAVAERDSAPAHAETVAMALAELDRCADALSWMRRGIANAEGAGDVDESARLISELPRYERSPCRRP